MALEIDLLRATMLPVKLCTSFVLLGDHMSINTCIFSGLASISRWLTINLGNVLDAMPNAHFSTLRILNVSANYRTRSKATLKLTSMSST